MTYRPSSLLGIALASIMLIGHPAHAAPATAGGHGALALGAIVGSTSPLLGARPKATLARLLADKTVPAYERGKITVKASAVTCTAGDVDIAAFTCTLTYTARNRAVTLTGRPANELFATLIEAGVQSEGAAGKIYEGLHDLSCTLDPAVIEQRAGGGASCTYEPGPAS